MRYKTGTPIDASKFDIRFLWSGIKEDHLSRDAGVVDGYPLDPPDEFSGWFLVDWGYETTKEADRYWGLWIREKSKRRAKLKPRKPRDKAQGSKPMAPAAPTENKRKGRKPRPAAPAPAATAPTQPEPQATTAEA